MCSQHLSLFFSKIIHLYLYLYIYISIYLSIYNIKYHIPSVNLNLIKNSVLFQGPKFWNDIPIDIRNKKSLVSFKTSYRKYLSPQ